MVTDTVTPSLRPTFDSLTKRYDKRNKEPGKSYRATRQVNKWNREAGYNKYDSRIVQEFPAGPKARENALDAEKRNATRLGDQLDIKIHKRPRP